MKIELTERLTTGLRAVSARFRTERGTHVARIARLMVPAAALIAALASTAWAQSPNLGDPLFCQPQEGVVFLIVNGGSGVFTVDPDCYNNNVNNDTTLSITTGQGGSLTGVRAVTSINYVYTPPTPTFTGLDTFSIPVTTVFNGAGGTGSAGGTVRPGGPTTLAITLNVIPSTTTLAALGVATMVPVPAGSVSSCSAPGNSGLGPAAGVILGCVTGITQGTLAPSHGTLTTVGVGLRYTTNVSYVGTDTFQYQAVGTNTDGTNALNSGNVTVQVTVTAALTITTASPLPTGVPGTAYSQTFAASGGAGGPYTFSLASGALPPGLTLAGGALSGTPTTPGVYNFTIQVTDSGSNTASKAFQLTVAPPLTITTASPLPTGVPSSAYAQTLAATGGIAPYTFSLASGALPPGLTLAGGILSGTPTTAGVYNFTIQVADSASNTASKAFQITISAPLTITTTPTLTAASLGSAYTQTFAASGGIAPYTFALLSGSLPTGMSISGAVLSGTPLTGGVFNFTIQVTDSASHTSTQTFTLAVVSPVPTLGFWGMALLCGLLLLFGTKALRRRPA